MPIKSIGTFRKQGRFLVNHTNRGQWRKSDWKKSMIKVDYEVDSEFQKNI